ncbi:TPA: hypothetical protein P0E36_005236 [Vibrio harveyi]|nr:hypothetical protein [Vibrio harveyi]
MRKADFFKPSIAGLGFIGDLVNPDDYPLIYGRWKALIQNGYVPVNKGIRNTNFTGHKLCVAWFNFGIFAIWFIEQCKLLGIDPKQKNPNIVLNCTIKSLRGQEGYSPSTTMLITRKQSAEAHSQDLRANLPIDWD